MVLPLTWAGGKAPRFRGALLTLGAVTALYLGLLAWLDSRNHLIAALPTLAAALPVVMAISVVSYAIRIARWQWLFRRAGHAMPWRTAAWVYVAGFAFTASPGKLGELIRLRYLPAVPVPIAVGEFFFERLLDLIAVLLLSALAIGNLPGLGVAASFVALVALAVALLVLWSGVASALATGFDRYGWTRVASSIRDFALGMHGIRRWCTPVDLGVTLTLSLSSWSVASASFVWLMAQFQLPIDMPLALAIYPLASLVGAASMLPGGMGSTELAIVAAMSLLGVPPGSALVAAIGIRVGTLWFALAIGVLAMLRLEWARAQAASIQRSVSSSG